MLIKVFDEELKLAIEYWQREYDDAWRIIDRFEVPEDREKRGVFFTALYAMREVLARREGCEHCVVNEWERKPLATWETSFDNCTTEKHEMHIEGYKKDFAIGSSQGHRGPEFEIHFCPKCGKKLD